MDENLYIWYCCILGIIGNTLTCLLLTRRIYAIKNRIKIRSKTTGGIITKMVSIGRAASTKNRHYSIYKQNLTIYLYFIAISFADLIMLLNWLASMLHINIKVERSMAFSPSATESIDTSGTSNTYTMELAVDKNPNTIHNNNNNNNSNDVFISLNSYFIRHSEYWFTSDSNQENQKDNYNKSLYLAYAYDHSSNQKHLNRLKEEITISQVYNLLKSNVTFDVFVPFNAILNSFENNIQHTKMKLIDIQGVCQIHYYLTMVSLYATIGYTLACLIERLFKMKHILHNEIFIDMYESRRGTITNSVSSDYESNITEANTGTSVHFNSNLNERKNSMASAGCANKIKWEPSFTANEEFELEEIESIESPKRQSYATVSSTGKRSMDSTTTTTTATPTNGRLIGRIENNSSDLVRQLFGKSSVVLIAIFIFLVNFHLMWLYGSQKSDEIEELEQIIYFKLDEISKWSPSSLTLSSINPTFNNGTIRIQTSKRSCQIFTIINQLPLFVMTVDLFLLFLLGLFKVGSLILLLCRFYKINIGLLSRLQSMRLIGYKKSVAMASLSEVPVVDMSKDWQKASKAKRVTQTSHTASSLKPIAHSSHAETSSTSTNRSTNARLPFVSGEKFSVDPKSNEDIQMSKRKNTTMSATLQISESSKKNKIKVERHASAPATSANHIKLEQQLQLNQMSQSKLTGTVSRSKLSRSNCIRVKRNAEHKKRKYFITKCLIMISLFSAFFALPSVFTRNILMIVLLAASNNQNGAPVDQQQAQYGGDNSNYQLDYHLAQTNHSLLPQQQSPVVSTSTTASLLNTTTFVDVDVTYGSSTIGSNSYASLEKILHDVCNILDLLLVFVTSHKFFIFIFQCYLIRMPNISSLKSRLFPNR
jgi:hypothetical protein